MTQSSSVLFRTVLAFALVSSAPVVRAASAPAALPSLAPVATCAVLAQLDLAPAAGAPVSALKAFEIASPKGPYCRVTGTIAPAIGFEVDLPVKGWTQRYLQTGCGGLCGNLSVMVEHAGTCAPALDGELVVASDDMGHQGKGMGDASFGADPQERIDFAYRGNHVTALVAKALIKAFYGQGPRFSYFSGCSDGGREALVEAERYPGDFDGIAAGAPAMNFQVQNSFYHAWMARSNTGPDGRAILVAGRLGILHRAAVAACDELDGLKDGLIADPRACHFDPAVAQCAPGASDSQDCLTAAEVEVARKFYAGPTDAAGRHFTIGGPQPGSELSWAGVYVPFTPDGMVMSRGVASSSFEYVILPEVSSADGDIDRFEFTQANFERLKALHPLYDATDTDLAAFQKRGGKLILWHGWSDPHISPINTIAYLHGVKAALGEETTNSFARLFLFPGMYHCFGGDGFSEFDVLTPLMAWVEGGAGPDRIIAAEAGLSPMSPPPGAPPMGPPRAGMPMGPPPMMAESSAERPAPLAQPAPPARRARPVFAYPMVAKYTGQGDINDPANYVASPGAVADPSHYDWEGADLMVPGFQKSYTVKQGKLTVDGPR